MKVEGTRTVYRDIRLKPRKRHDFPIDSEHKKNILKILNTIEKNIHDSVNTVLGSLSIKPSECPFCKGFGIDERVEDMWEVSCTKCGATTQLCEYRHDAILIWNEEVGKVPADIGDFRLTDCSRNEYRKSCHECNKELVTIADHYGGGSHYWVMVCPSCGQGYSFDSCEFKTEKMELYEDLLIHKDRVIEEHRKEENNES